MAASPHRTLALVVALGLALGAMPAGAATHPGLLFDRSDVPAIRAALDGPLRQIKDALEAGVHFPFVGDYPRTPDANWQYYSDPRAIADSLLAFSFGAAILDPASARGQEASQLALAYLRGICGYSDWIFPHTQDDNLPDLNSAHFLFGVSLAYDWLYDKMSESDRQRCRDRVAIEGEKMYQATRNGWWVPEYLQNHNWINHASLGMAALAFDGEIGRDTGAWLAAAKSNSEKVQFVLDLIQGGTWHEGTGYLHYGLDSLIPFSAALVRAQGGPDYADNQIVRDYATLRQQMMPPAKAHRREYVLWGDFSGLQNENTLLPLYYAGRKYRDGNAMWYAEQFLDGQTAGKGGLTTWPPGQRGMLLAAIFYDASVPAVPPSRNGGAWELDHYAHDLSLFTSRSGWEDGGTLLALKSGVFGGHGNWERLRDAGWPGGSINFGHDHADDMGVQFFADGEWLTTRVPGYWIGRNNGAAEVNRTKYANSLLVDGSGQIGEGLRTCWMGSCSWFWSRQGSIPVRGSTANFSYALGAGSQLYDPSLGLTGFGRSMLFLDRRFPVIRDVVRGTQSRNYEIVWHAADAASRDGSWLRLNAKNDRVLGVNVVAPAAFDVRTENQTATHLNKFDSDGSMTAMVVRPRTPAKDATFLSALIPARGSSWNERPTVRPIDPDVADRGLVLEGLPGGERYEVVFNDAAESSSSAAGIAVTGMAGVRKTRGDVVERAFLAAGQLLELDGVAWIEVRDGTRATIEVEVVDGGIAVSGEERALRLYAPEARRVTYNGVEVPFDREGAFVRLPGTDDPGPGGGGGSGGSGGAGGGGAGGGGAGGGGGCAELPPVEGLPGLVEKPLPGLPSAGAGGTTGGDVEGGCGGSGGGGGGAGGDGGATEPPAKKKRRSGCSTAGEGALPVALAIVALGIALPRRLLAPARTRRR